jgi:hypothetical protein
MSIDSGKRTTPAAVRVTGGPAVHPDLDAWRDEVRRTDDACAAHGLGAAVVSIALADPDGTGPDASRRQALGALSGVLRPSDSIGVLADDELGVVLVPVEGHVDARLRVGALDAALRDHGCTAAVGWAMRTDDLFAAAARADAAMASARRAQRPIESHD